MNRFLTFLCLLFIANGLLWLTFSGCSGDFEPHQEDPENCTQAVPLGVGAACESSAHCALDRACVRWECIDNRCRADTLTFEGAACFECDTQGICTGGVCK